MTSHDLTRYVWLKLAALGHPLEEAEISEPFVEFARPLLRNYHQKNLLLEGRLCPADERIQRFLDRFLQRECPEGSPRLPSHTFSLDQAGLARLLSLPEHSDTFASSYLTSYRIAQGVLHNPLSDRRTTQGVFHIVEGGIAIPADKIAVPRATFAKLLSAAFESPPEDLLLPFTATRPTPVRTFISLLLRPLVCPATGRDEEKRMEIRFFAPGSLVSNLDFVEGIFGNGGDPYLPENDAALDARHFSGHTGCVILAPHLTRLRKRDLALPHVSEATDRQKRDGMCWEREDELYNGGSAFKVTCRDASGVIVTVIADNYYGYCKKEVKTQISFAANLFGLCEEEHAGGAIAFASYVLGQSFDAEKSEYVHRRSFQEAITLLNGKATIRPEGYAVDNRHPEIVYVPENSQFNAVQGYVKWKHGDTEQQIRLRAGEIYILPSGYRVALEKQHHGSHWRLVGTRPDGTLCHKPCTVSGGGKSEISKSISSALLKGPIFIKEYGRDMDRVKEILTRDYTNAYREPDPRHRASRPMLSSERSLGSVIKLLTPSPIYTDEYNDWVRQLPQTIRQIVFTVKRYYRPEWGSDWLPHFTVDRINGYLGHELKFNDEKLQANYLRVGFDPEGSWRIHKLRPDFNPAAKVQVEDDITASVVLPREAIPHLDPQYQNESLKLVENCESLLFQRPDDAIHRGMDRQAETDIASPGTFLSNFEPLSRATATEIVDHVIEFDRYTDPMKQLLTEFVHGSSPDWVVSSAHPRLVDGRPSKNPRYLQKRPDLVDALGTYAAEVAAQLHRRIPAGEPVRFPVNAVLAGRRGSPAEPSIGLPPLAVYGPIHYQELPELFMDFICSLTGKSPSTTGFGSEGALTKRPFNALPPIVDINNALVAAILTGYAGFTTAAAYVGPKVRVDHDISMLVPELWCRMTVAERDPLYLLSHGYLEPLNDYTHRGQPVLASRLGYRITALFAEHILGRIFETPDAVFTSEMLRPEEQDADQYAEGIQAIVEAQRHVALEYIEDGSIAAACPPIAAILHIMAYGNWEGHQASDAAVRSLFTRESLLSSTWYRERLVTKQARDCALWKRHLDELSRPNRHLAVAGLSELRAYAEAQHARVSSTQYLQELRGTLGADPFEGLVDQAT